MSIVEIYLSEMKKGEDGGGGEEEMRCMSTVLLLLCKSVEENKNKCDSPLLLFS